MNSISARIKEETLDLATLSAAVEFPWAFVTNNNEKADAK